MTSIYIDGDACPVRGEVFRAAARRGLKVFVVANNYISTPEHGESIVVKGGQDAADDWIAEHSGPGDAVVTADIALAARCLKMGAACMGPTGREFTDANIGSALAARDILKQIRQASGRETLHKQFSDRDRKHFMKEFSQLLDRLARS